ncbi:MAG: FAA hydrolase family protein [Proteobacteria bacterium]|nr:FAA hydrolase family protein [Pseudomonadota bacterium]
MRFVTFLGTCGSPRLGLVDETTALALDITALAPDAPADCDALVAGGEHTLERVRTLISSASGSGWLPLESLVLAPPLRRPGKIMAIGLNYRDHAEEQNIEPPPAPLMFAKFASSIVGPEAPVEIPPASSRIDYEVELAVIIGRRGRMISPEAARDHIFGYTIINDVTARDLQRSDRQWVRAKSFDTFCPMGPAVVTVDALEFPPQRDIEMRVNGEVRQRSNTRRMIFDVPTLVSWLSEAFTLEPGDIISTGTPAGVGVFRNPPVFLTEGDVMEASIDGLGVLRNPVTHRPPGRP